MNQRGYTEVTVIVAGAIEDEQIFEADQGHLLDAYLNAVAVNAKEDGEPTEVYLLEHSHPILDENEEVIECACAQYVTDQHPAFVYNEPKRSA